MDMMSIEFMKSLCGHIRTWASALRVLWSVPAGTDTPGGEDQF